MRELLEQLDRWSAEGARVGRAVVVRTFGSAPRPEGGVLLVTEDGRLAGSVSGGCVEGAAAEEIARALRDGRQRVVRYGISDEDAWDVGLMCGGTIDVLVQPGVPAQAVAAARDTAAARAVVTLLPAGAPPPVAGPHAPGPGEEPGEPIVVDAAGGLQGSLGDAAADARLSDAARGLLADGLSGTVEAGGRQAFIESFPVRPRLVVVGAVEVTRTLVALAREVGYETIVVDGRPAFATRARFPDVDRLIVAWPDEAADEIGLGPADAVVVLSHDPKFDEPAIAEALRRRCRYVGAIGSRKAQADRRRRLLEAGVPSDDLDRLRGPIGLDLGGRLPPETALAILGEVVAERRSGSGRPMRDILRERAAAR